MRYINDPPKSPLKRGTFSFDGGRFLIIDYGVWEVWFVWEESPFLLMQLAYFPDPVGPTLPYGRCMQRPYPTLSHIQAIVKNLPL